MSCSNAKFRVQACSLKATSFIIQIYFSLSSSYASFPVFTRTQKEITTGTLDTSHIYANFRRYFYLRIFVSQIFKVKFSKCRS